MVAPSSLRSQARTRTCASCNRPMSRGSHFCRECFDREWAAWVRQQFGPDAPTEIAALSAWRNRTLPPQRNRAIPSSGEEPPSYADEIDCESRVKL